MISLTLSPPSLTPTASSFSNSTISSPTHLGYLTPTSTISPLNFLSQKESQPRKMPSRTSTTHTIHTAQTRRTIKYPSIRLSDDDKKLQLSPNNLSLNIDTAEPSKPRMLSPLDSSQRKSSELLMGDIADSIVLKTEVPGYLQPTFAAIRRSIRVTDSNANERNFKFAMSQKQSPGYNTPANLSSDDSKSPVIAQRSKNRGSLFKNEALARNSGVFERKSVFYRHSIKKGDHSVKAKKSIQSVEVVQYPKDDEIIQEKTKAGQKRMSSILTKELEARYNVRIVSSESLSSSNESEGEEDEEKEQTKLDFHIETVETVGDQDTSKMMVEYEIKSNDACSDRGDRDEGKAVRRNFTENSFQMRNETSESDIFSSEQGRFFEFNQTNRFLQEMGKSYTGFDIISGTKKNEQASGAGEDKRRGKPVIAKVGVDNHLVVQPEFMKTSGSMCFTEFWSKKYNTVFSRLMKDKAKSIKVYGKEDELVYRPKRWKEEEKVKAKIQRKDYSIEPAKNVVEPKASFGEGKTKPLPLIKSEVSASSGSFQRTWHAKTLTKIAKIASSENTMRNSANHENKENKDDAEKQKYQAKTPKSVRNYLSDYRKSK